METTTNTPITDMVREQRDDYLAAVEALEQSHAILLDMLDMDPQDCSRYVGKATHTTRPWIVCTPDDDNTILSIEQDCNEIDGEPSIIAEVDLCGEGIDATIGASNARLIAAAPDLLEVAKYAAMVANYNDEHEPDPEHLTHLLYMARAAIAKAEQ